MRLATLIFLIASGASAQPMLDPPFLVGGVVSPAALGALIGPECDRGYSDARRCYTVVAGTMFTDAWPLRSGAGYGWPESAPRMIVWAWSGPEVPADWDAPPSSAEASVYRGAERLDWQTDQGFAAFVRVAPGRAVTVRRGQTPAALDSSLALVDLDALRALPAETAYVHPQTYNIRWSPEASARLHAGLTPAVGRVVLPERLEALLPGIEGPTASGFELYDEDSEDQAGAVPAVVATLTLRGGDPGATATLELASLAAAPGRARTVLNAELPRSARYFRERTTRRGVAALVGNTVRDAPIVGPPAVRSDPTPRPTRATLSFDRTTLILGDGLRVSAIGTDSVLAARLLAAVDLQRLAAAPTETVAFVRDYHSAHRYEGAFSVGERRVRMPYPDTPGAVDLVLPAGFFLTSTARMYSPRERFDGASPSGVGGVHQQTLAVVCAQPLDPGSVVAPGTERHETAADLASRAPFAVVRYLGSIAGASPETVLESLATLTLYRRRLLPAWSDGLAETGPAARRGVRIAADLAGDGTYVEALFFPLGDAVLSVVGAATTADAARRIAETIAEGIEASAD